MDEEKKEVSETKEKTEEKSEETEEKETKDEFEEKEESVPVGKYNQVVRKQREADLEKRELEKQLAEAKKTNPEKEESEEEDVFKEEKEKLPDINHLIDEKVKPVLERLNKKEADDRKNQRDTFFEKHPEYLDAKKWNELLDEVDNSLNPNSKDNHYTQLEKAHRILTGESGYSDINKKKQELAADSASKGDGANKPEGKKSSEDDRADRLSRKMPKGYEFKI